jgi:hypothetical protein
MEAERGDASRISERKENESVEKINKSKICLHCVERFSKCHNILYNSLYPTLDLTRLQRQHRRMRENSQTQKSLYI